MSTRRATPYRVKINRSYSVQELAACCGVHKNTVRNWQSGGLAPIDKGRPVLFQGAAIRAFLTKRNAGRKRPCKPGTMYCFRCREPRAPALAMVDYVPVTPISGNLRAICEHCGAMMHRRARKADLLVVIRFTRPPKTRGERVQQVHVETAAHDDAEMRAFLVGVLGAYAEHGESELSLTKLGTALAARYGTIADAKAKLGDIPRIREAFVAVQRDLYLS